MGLTKTTNSPGLSFDFDNARAQYSPGDVISGHVVLNTAADAAIGTVTVSFWGRAKSRIIQQHGQSASYHRGRTRFFHLEKVLYEGQYTHKPGSFSWPFDFVVPNQADQGCILPGGSSSSEKWKPKEHYRSNLDENKNNNELDLNLPPSMSHSRMNMGRKADCFIEYVLEATLTEPRGIHQFRGPKTKTSTYPIIFNPLSTPEPIQNYDLVTEERLFTISTLKLLPEHAGTSLGIRDRARSLFQKDTVPRFSFSLTVQAPSVIQLFHPKPLPFLITIQPDLRPENTTIDTSTSLPEVVLRSVKIELKTEVRCRAPGTYADTKTYEIPILSIRHLTRPLTFAKGLSGPDESTLDLGSLYDLRVGNAKLGSKVETPLCPNFTSYNVTREYYLTWELEVECAEKTERFSSPRSPPQCTVLLPPATACMDGYNPNPLLGADLAQAASTASRDSEDGHSFWSRRKSGEGRGEKEKPSFSSLGLDSRSSGKKPKTKAEEAAEERQADFTSDVDEGMNADSNSSVSDQDFNSRRTRGAHGADQPPPRYVP